MHLKKSLCCIYIQIFYWGTEKNVSLVLLTTTTLYVVCTNRSPVLFLFDLEKVIFIYFCLCRILQWKQNENFSKDTSFQQHKDGSYSEDQSFSHQRRRKNRRFGLPHENIFPERQVDYKQINHQFHYMYVYSNTCIVGKEKLVKNGFLFLFSNGFLMCFALGSSWILVFFSSKNL